MALERAWDELNWALDRRVRVSMQMRVTARVHDLLTFVTLLRSLELEELRRRDEFDAQVDAKWDTHSSFQFSAAVKATYYVVRALQDAVYAALLEASGRRAGGYSSMYACAKNDRNPIHLLIAAALPEYFVWFFELRDIRNKLKLGVSSSFNYIGAPGAKRLRLAVQDVTMRAGTLHKGASFHGGHTALF